MVSAVKAAVSEVKLTGAPVWAASCMRRMTRSTLSWMMGWMLAMERHVFDFRREFAQQLVKPLVSQLGRAPLLPHRNQLVDGAEHATHQDRAGNHHPGGHVAFDHQQRAQA